MTSSCRCLLFDEQRSEPLAARRTKSRTRIWARTCTEMSVVTDRDIVERKVVLPQLRRNKPEFPAKGRKKPSHQRRDSRCASENAIYATENDVIASVRIGVSREIWHHPHRPWCPRHPSRHRRDRRISASCPLSVSIAGIVVPDCFWISETGIMGPHCAPASDYVRSRSGEIDISRGLAAIA